MHASASAPVVSTRAISPFVLMFLSAHETMMKFTLCFSHSNKTFDHTIVWRGEMSFRKNALFEEILDIDLLNRAVDHSDEPARKDRSWLNLYLLQKRFRMPTYPSVSFAHLHDRAR